MLSTKEIIGVIILVLSLSISIWSAAFNTLKEVVFLTIATVACCIGLILIMI